MQDDPKTVFKISAKIFSLFVLLLLCKLFLEQSAHCIPYLPTKVWPDVQIYNYPIFSKVTQKLATPVWFKIWWFSKLPKMSLNVWDTFEWKFVAKCIQKRPILSHCSYLPCSEDGWRSNCNFYQTKFHQFIVKFQRDAKFPVKIS